MLKACEQVSTDLGTFWGFLHPQHIFSADLALTGTLIRNINEQRYSAIAVFDCGRLIHQEEIILFPKDEIWQNMTLLKHRNFAIHSLFVILNTHLEMQYSWLNNNVLYHSITGVSSHKAKLTNQHSERPKKAWWFVKYFTYRSSFWKTFEGEM